MVAPVRVALVGAHGTGKTTLSREITLRLSADRHRVATLQEVPRLVCEMVNDPTFFRQTRNTALKQALLLFAQLVHESEKSHSAADVVLGDRTPLDHWAYTLHFFSSAFSTDELGAIYETLIAQHAMRTYRAIFYLPIEFPVVDDGVREDDVAFQKSIDERILSLLRRYSIPFTTLRGSVDERASTSMQVITELLRGSTLGGAK